MTMPSLDDKIKSLLKVVEEKKAAIKQAESPKWETNCSFRWSEASNNTCNLHVCDKEKLIEILSYLWNLATAHDAVCKQLEISNHTFKHSGFTYAQWSKDIKTRLNIVEIAKTKKELELLEEKLNELMSPQLKAMKALEEIEGILND